MLEAIFVLRTNLFARCWHPPLFYLSSNCIHGQENPFETQPSDQSIEQKPSWDEQKEKLLPGVVTIEGPNGSGTGFLTQINDTIVVITNIHILECASSESPELKIRTLSNTTLSPIGIYGAMGHDIALLRIPNEKDLAEFVIPYSPNLTELISIEDEISIPGNSKGGGALLWTKGDVIGLGPDRIEHNAPTYQGNSGSPIIHRISAKVIGVESYATYESLSNDVYAKSSFQNRDSPIKSDVRHFAYRLDSVKSWYAINLKTFCDFAEKMGKYKEERSQILGFLFSMSENEWQRNRRIVSAWNHFTHEIDNFSNNRRDYVGSDGYTNYYRSYSTISPIERKRIKKRLIGDLHNIVYSQIYTDTKRGQICYDYFTEELRHEAKIRDWIMGYLKDWNFELNQ